MIRSARTSVASRLCSKKLIRKGHRRYTSASLPSDCVIFSGIQPTGVPHVGNYLGALRQWVNLQNSLQPSARLIFSIVDLHALTVRQHRQQLLTWKRESLATLLAVGLDPERCLMFFQSDVRFSSLKQGHK